MARAGTPHDRTPADDGLQSLRRLLALRWLSIGGELSLVFATRELLGIALPVPPILALLGCQIALNLFTHVRVARGGPASNAELFVQLSLDAAVLSGVVALAGGAANPLISLYLPLVAVGAAVLPSRLALGFAALSIAAYSAIAFLLPEAHIHDAERAFALHLVGMWFVFVLSAATIAFFVTRMTTAIRARDRELALAREAALRDERAVALGSLAAGAAHELGTPLATIAVLAGELARDAGRSADEREDLILLGEQVERCKAIISRLAANAGSPRLDSAQAESFEAWLRAVIERWSARRASAAVRLELSASGRAPLVAPSPTLEQALCNVFDNACDASPGDVQIQAHADAERIAIAAREGGGTRARIDLPLSALGAA